MRGNAPRGDHDDTERLRTLLREADEAVEVPDDLWERTRAPRIGAPRPAAAAHRPRWRAVPALVTAAAVALVALVGALAGAGLLRPRQWHLPPLGAGRPGVTLTVYNAEAACQTLHTIECSLDLIGNPHDQYAAQYAVGRVWHGEQVVADCVVADGTLVTDEAGVSSKRWYRVTLPEGTTGWLPGVRTHNTTEVPLCATDPAAPPSP